ncbi:PD-(D/E)XK motif protein [Glycomyces tritici]|uniref:PD-(D/E)XK motif protein n=1 Tax=Glycomyces tritici TaxID=2665176 RepID=A0ABT7YJ61_9ACTN|nr:PD-(D/E)XK motif protein [Glycomyces tritici]MDN3238675.1 PD-(D/E)XK motif protein [Glycomyces tritici]
MAWSTVEEQLADGMGVRYPLSNGTGPEVHYDVEDGGDGISLLVGLDRTQKPPRSPLSAVKVDTVFLDGRRSARFSTTRPELLRDFHDLVMAIAERIVIKGASLERAFDSTVHAWNALLDRPRSMSMQQRLGLHGELAVLQCLAEQEGWPAAIDAWVGPQGEEHDFALAGCDLEVKTTASELRRHTIHGVGQLQEKTNRPLWFISLQLTRSGGSGTTLSESVGAVRQATADSDLRALQKLNDAFTAVGLNPGHVDDEHWTIRNDPLVLSTTSMPRLTLEMLPAATSGHIAAVVYDVDVTGAQSADDCPIDLSTLRLP